MGEIVDLQAGLFHVVAVKSDGSFVVWGQNELNQLEVPKKLDKVDKVYVGRFHTYAVDKEGKIYAWGNKGYLFGTDSQGRSLLHRILQVGRVSMTVGAIAVLISLVIRVTTGLVAGFYGGWIDNIIMRFSEVVNSFRSCACHYFILGYRLPDAIRSKDVFDYGHFGCSLVAGPMPAGARANPVRTGKGFRNGGKSTRYPRKEHHNPAYFAECYQCHYCQHDAFVCGKFAHGSRIIVPGLWRCSAETVLGNLLTGAQNLSVIQEYWWLWILPALFIVVTALSINLIGDGLREAMDPKANQR